MIGNTKLVQYGIFTEKSDLRAHVAVLERAVYVYATEDMLQLLNSREYRTAPVYTGKIKTAEGFLVPPPHVPHIQRVLFPDAWVGRVSIEEDLSTTEKGDKAAKIVSWFLRHNRVLLPLNVRDVRQQDLQISGVDILVKTRVAIQVKCDYRASLDRGIPPKCTGNLFVQFAECNPYKRS